MQLPRILIDRLKILVEKNPHLGLLNHSQAAKQAISEFLEKHEIKNEVKYHYSFQNKRKNKTLSFVIQGDTIFCKQCNTSNCACIGEVLATDEIVEQFRKDGVEVDKLSD